MPKIILGGRTYTAAKPKMKVWRELIRLKSANSINDRDALDQIYRLLSEVFNVAPDLIEKELNSVDLLPVFNEVCEWIDQIISAKLLELPNVLTPAA